MAAQITRTAADDALDALLRLHEAEREIAHWRAHLQRVAAGGALPTVLQARRCAGIVAGVIGDAVSLTRDAVCHAELPADALPA